jgi:hypothetical protein
MIDRGSEVVYATAREIASWLGVTEEEVEAAIREEYIALSSQRPRS